MSHARVDAFSAHADAGILADGCRGPLTQAPRRPCLRITLRGLAVICTLPDMGPREERPRPCISLGWSWPRVVFTLYQKRRDGGGRAESLSHICAVLRASPMSHPLTPPVSLPGLRRVSEHLHPPCEGGQPGSGVHLWLCSLSNHGLQAPR